MRRRSGCRGRPGGARRLVRRCTAWTWPADGPVLRPFALGADPYAGGQHRGVDIGAEVGDAVRAPAAGTVSFAGSVPGGGRGGHDPDGDGYAVTLLQLGSTTSCAATRRRGSAVGGVGESADAVTAAHTSTSVSASPPSRTATSIRSGCSRLGRLPRPPAPAPSPAPVPAPSPPPPRRRACCDRASGGVAAPPEVTAEAWLSRRPAGNTVDLSAEFTAGVRAPRDRRARQAAGLRQPDRPRRGRCCTAPPLPRYGVRPKTPRSAGVHAHRRWSALARRRRQAMRARRRLPWRKAGARAAASREAGRRSTRSSTGSPTRRLVRCVADAAAAIPGTACLPCRRSPSCGCCCSGHGWLAAAARLPARGSAPERRSYDGSP